jgi:hypothetical protein
MQVAYEARRNGAVVYLPKLSICESYFPMNLTARFDVCIFIDQEYAEILTEINTGVYIHGIEALKY